MFLIDDFLIWLSELMRDYALKEKYNVEAINNQIKENRLLFEIGEITEKEYKEKHELLLEGLETAKEVMEKLSKDIEVKEGI